MKKQMRQALTLLLSLATVLTLTCGTAWAVKSGSCGENVKWKVDGSTLIISGKGAMDSYASDTDPDVVKPWDEWNNSIKKIVIKSGVTNIGGSAFSYSTATSVSIPKTVKKIEPCAFEMSALKSVTIPVSVTSIGKNAFYGTRLTKVTLPKKLTGIQDGVFGNTTLSKITIPNSVTSIGNGAFFGTNLTCVTIPGKVKRIGAYAFSDCKKLKTIMFTGNAPEINPEYPFDGVTATVFYPAGNQTWTAKKLAEYGKITYSSGKLTWKKWNPCSTTLTSVRGGKKKVTVKWKKNKKVDGYQVQYSTGKTFKSAKKKTVKGASKTSATIKKLKGKKRYYVRVRTCKKDSGKTYYSSWSKAKSVKTKR